MMGEPRDEALVKVDKADERLYTSFLFEGVG
jgi:hypothetical protein